MTETFTVYRKIYEPTDPRLGRHVRHDSRSLRYQVEAQDVATLKSIRHTRYIPTLDQGNLGSCTGNAGTGVIGSGVFWSTLIIQKQLSQSDANLDEQFAINLYSDATKVDPYQGSYPPNDTGSDGLSVAQVLKNRGLISGYTHATSLEAALTALASQPVMVGTEWRQNMFHVNSDGRLTITGSVAGGHEYVLDELDVENKRVWIHNSWADDWGLEGRAYLTWDDFGTLLDADGDCTALVPLAQPAPTPTPDPTPTPTPTPDPTPTPPAPDTDFIQAARTFSTALDAYLAKQS